MTSTSLFIYSKCMRRAEKVRQEKETEVSRKEKETRL